MRQDAAHALNANGTLPLNLSWSNGFRADFADGLDLRIQSAGLSVAFLNAFSGKSLENIAGEVSLDGPHEIERRLAYSDEPLAEGVRIRVVEHSGTRVKVVAE